MQLLPDMPRSVGKKDGEKESVPRTELKSERKKDGTGLSKRA